MDRFSILYLFKSQYKHISYPTRTEANAALADFVTNHQGNPFGIYDAKTELFYWEVTQFESNKMSIQEQGKRGNEVINIIQTLRSQEEARLKDEELREGDVLMRPLPLTGSKLTMPFFHVPKQIAPLKKEKKRASARRQKFAFK